MVVSDKVPEKNRPICVLTSGGVDSALLLQSALDSGHQITPLNISTGFLWEEAERHWLDLLLKSLASPRLAPLRSVRMELSSVLDLTWAFTGQGTPNEISPDEAVYIPGRNLILFSLASLLCDTGGMEEIWIGSLKHNPFGDTTPDFFKNFEEACRLAMGISVQIRAPFREWEKNELIRRFPDFPYELTFSCIHPDGWNHCGRCNKCEERRMHLKKAGIPDKTRYANG